MEPPTTKPSIVIIFIVVVLIVLGLMGWVWQQVYSLVQEAPMSTPNSQIITRPATVKSTGEAPSTPINRFSDPAIVSGK